MWPRLADPNLARLRDLRRVVEQCFGFAPFPVQERAALSLQRRTIVELDTGQGKTVTGALAAILQVEDGERVWISTANDYLARRDAEWMQPLYQACGLSVGFVVDGMPQPERRRQYARDIVYGTMREFGFDYLRSRLSERGGQSTTPWDGSPFQNSLIVDEADSLLIDEAATPLIISQPGTQVSPEKASLYRWASVEAADYRADEHFEIDARAGQVQLTESGRERFLTHPLPPDAESFSQNELIEALERAIFVNIRHRRDRDYVVRDNRLVIVDEFTGRTSEERSWTAGIHQAIEAREGIPLTNPGETAATITVQDFATRFRRLSGMTGTAREAARELRAVYRLRVQAIPPHQPSRRSELPAVVVPTLAARSEAIAEESSRECERGRPVLIGTRTIEASEELANALASKGIPNVLLNARTPEKEATIVAEAGRPGRVTIATNMAGRGTDIRLTDDARTAGGLHVIIAELNASPRIDRQLSGRCGRQGDPGTYRFILSGEDPIVTAAWDGRNRPVADLKTLKKAQQVIERRQQSARLILRMMAERTAENSAVLGLDPVVDPIDL